MNSTVAVCYTYDSWNGNNGVVESTVTEGDAAKQWCARDGVKCRRDTNYEQRVEWTLSGRKLAEHSAAL